MIAIETNILVYAHRSDMPQHARAKPAVRDLAEGSRGWAIPWPVVHEFFRVVTDTRLFKTATPPELAFAQLSDWLESPFVQVIGESIHHLDTLQELAIPAFIKGPKIHDARIAAICLSHGVTELWSSDRDFSSFPQLRVFNPIVF
jgi:uncharacterized protein